MSELDLDNPKDARKFLRGVRVNGHAITHVILADGSQLDIEAMSDRQVVMYAKDVYFDYCGGIEGERGTIDLEGVDQ